MARRGIAILFTLLGVALFVSIVSFALYVLNYSTISGLLFAWHYSVTWSVTGINKHFNECVEADK